MTNNEMLDLMLKKQPLPDSLTEIGAPVYLRGNFPLPKETGNFPLPEKLERVRITGMHIPQCGRLCRVLARPFAHTLVIVPFATKDDPKPSAILVGDCMVECVNSDATQ